MTLTLTMTATTDLGSSMDESILFEPQDDDEQAQAALPSIPDSNLEEASAMVQALFGSSVGPCWGDYFCTHNRIRGRLYASSLAILFYSNLLGFERRICLRFREIQHMELYRTTSIKVTMHDTEIYVFRSFNNREQVLHVLKGLKILSDRNKRQQLQRQQRQSLPPRGITTSTTTNRTRASYSASTGDTVMNGTTNNTTGVPTSRSLRATLSSSFVNNNNNNIGTAFRSSAPPPPLTPLVLNRKRSASDSMLHPQQQMEEDEHEEHEQQQQQSSSGYFSRFMSASSSSERHFDDDEDLFDGKALGEEDMEEEEPSSSHATTTTAYYSSHYGDSSDEEDDVDRHSHDDDNDHRPPVELLWSEAKEFKCPNSDNVGIEKLVLPISFEKFFEMFLADDAKYSLDYYQEKYIGDRDIKLTGWEVDDLDGVLKRTITFTHPIKNSFGVGPSEAQTTRKQQLRRCKNLGMTVENTTICTGIPSADAFYVQDHWLIEATNDNEVTISTRFGSTFTKRSMIRGLIEKNVIKETSEWFNGYKEMVQEALQETITPSAKAALPRQQQKVARVVDNLAPITDLLRHISRSLDRTAYIGAVVLLVLCFILVMQLLVMRQTMALVQDELSTLREEVGIIMAAVKE